MLKKTWRRLFTTDNSRGMGDEAKRMAVLSFLSYAECWNLKPERVEEGVRKAVNTAGPALGVDEIVWGPTAYRKKGILLTDSLMYAVRDKSAKYTLVIRGTNPGSITSWIFQDLSVNGLVPWTRRSPKTTHRNAWISMATDNALDIHETLADKGKTVLEWLLGLLKENSAERIELALTGHSLGGLMSTVFALYLRDELVSRKLDKRVAITICAFAGPTAGNQAFSDALEAEFGDALSLYDNPLDIAPLAWEEHNLASVMPVLYEPTIKPNKIQRDALSTFEEAVRGLGYTKPAKRIKQVPSSVIEVPFDDFLLEAVVQHVAAYAEEALKGAAKPVDAEVRLIVKKLLGVAQLSNIGQPNISGRNAVRKQKLKALAKRF